jgi:uptake hydrogenase large subunit
MGRIRMAKKTITLPFNRVEGDLEIRLVLEDNVVSEAFSIGTMYRGFENLLRGRGPLDGLVITPRICGICTTAHLKAAAKALDMMFSVEVPDNAVRVRNTTMMVEQIQNDMRHSFLLFMSDFTHPAYQGQPLYEMACKRYTPLTGKTAVETIQQTKNLLEIIAILGGQWPHSSFMVPGGVLTISSPNDIATCRYLLESFRKWYEKKILGCTIEHFRKVKSVADLKAWFADDKAHRESDLGAFARLSRQVGLDQMGRGFSNFISFGSLEMPRQTDVDSLNGHNHFLPAGFLKNGQRNELRQEKITEEIARSWFSGYDWGRHPFSGLTNPAIDQDGQKYSWAKAPRYDGFPAETGPLSQLLIADDPLFADLIKRQKGASAFSRQLARIVRPAYLLPILDQWLKEIAIMKEDFFKDYVKSDFCQGFGMIEAPRGALGHWVKIKNGVIEKYQIITPTAWNASPKDTRGVRGPCEEALIGTKIKDPKNPIEVEHIVRSFDPCLVCTVHVIDTQAQFPPVSEE